MGILICGLNGTGKSTLGRMLAGRMGYEFIDNEGAVSLRKVRQSFFYEQKTYQKHPKP